MDEIFYSEEDLAKWRQAGKISAEALQYGLSLIKPGASVLEVCDAVDKKIFSLGARPSFPSQVSLNDVAAHFCPDAEDKLILSDQVVKLDVGASVDGFLGDTAATVDLSGRHEKLVAASKDALAAAVSVAKAGVRLNELGRVIEQKINSYGYRPIINLSGHGIGKFQVHTSPTVPNFDNRDEELLYDGQFIAIEPFATNGSGSIYESTTPTVFMQVAKKPVRSSDARQLLAEIQKYEGLPFARRWLEGNTFKVNFALRQLISAGCVQVFPPLVERNHGLVSQAEHTVLVRKDGCEVLTAV
ncbi:type II methionyl aminopeptidase [Candidatus Woesearchaeota archaeon]|nr:type II methionyl aminopeptidase [Candidatus Woesearchaeota archaeon]